MSLEKNVQVRLKNLPWNCDDELHMHEWNRGHKWTLIHCDHYCQPFPQNKCNQSCDKSAARGGPNSFSCRLRKRLLTFDPVKVSRSLPSLTAAFPSFMFPPLLVLGTELTSGLWPVGQCEVWSQWPGVRVDVFVLLLPVDKPKQKKKPKKSKLQQLVPAPPVPTLSYRETCLCK